MRELEALSATNRSLVVIKQFFHLMDEDSGKKQKKAGKQYRWTGHHYTGTASPMVTRSVVKLHQFLHYIFLHLCSQFGIYRQSDGLVSRFFRNRA